MEFLAFVEIVFTTKDSVSCMGVHAFQTYPFAREPDVYLVKAAVSTCGRKLSVCLEKSRREDHVPKVFDGKVVEFIVPTARRVHGSPTAPKPINITGVLGRNSLMIWRGSARDCGRSGNCFILGDRGDPLSRGDPWNRGDPFFLWQKNDEWLVGLDAGGSLRGTGGTRRDT